MASKQSTSKSSAKATSYWAKARGIFGRLNIVQKSALVLAICFSIVTLFTYLGAVYYTVKHRDEQLKIGATFIPNYARYYGLDPQETMDALMQDMGLKRFRLVSYWKDIEKTKGTYDFSELDWQFKKAEAAGAEVSLAIGLRQPRWPECHEPDWAKGRPISEWQTDLYNFIEATVKRYKDSPALESYQLENEFFMSVFGECPDFSRDRLVAEKELVKRVDPDTKLVITRSNNWGGVPIGDPTPDQFGVSVYKRVWDKTLTKRYFEYPYPSWFYASLAGYGEMVSGKDMIIHELQTEAWLPEGFQMNDLNDIPEQNKSLDAPRLEKRLEFGVNTGIKTIDVWGVEWWYWRKVKANDPSLWDTGKQEIERQLREANS